MIESGRPAVVVLHLGFRCNNRCRFCLHGTKRDIMAPPDTAELVALANSARARGGHLVITGGEPAIRPDFEELIGAIQALSFESVTLETNGRMFAYKPFAVKAAARGIGRFRVALQGHTAELHEYLTQVPESFRQTASGIQHLKAMRCDVQVATVITRSNYRHLPSVVAVAAKLKVDGIRFRFIQPTGAVEDEFVRLVPRFALVEAYVRQAFTAAYESGIAAEIEGMPLCFLTGLEAYAVERKEPAILTISQEGEFLSTPESRMADLKDKPATECPRCAGKPQCEGVWRGYAKSYGWSEFEDGESDPLELHYAKPAAD